MFCSDLRLLLQLELHMHISWQLCNVIHHKVLESYQNLHEILLCKTAIDHACLSKTTTYQIDGELFHTSHISSSCTIFDFSQKVCFPSSA